MHPLPKCFSGQLFQIFTLNNYPRSNEDGRVFIYYASSDTHMHVAESTIDRLTNYVMHTPAEGFTSAASVKTLNKIIGNNKKLHEPAAFQIIACCNGNLQKRWPYNYMN